MAQSCNLIYSVEDRDNFPLPERIDLADEAHQLKHFWGSSTFQGVEPVPIRRIDEGRIEIDPLAAAAHGVDRTAQTAFAQRHHEWSKESREAAASLASARPDIQPALIRGFGNPALLHGMADALPRALLDFRKEYPNSVGLIDTAGKERGPWQSSWLSDLGNRGKGVANGIAYELLMANRMRFTSVDGLRLYRTDQPSFGQKMQGKYGKWGSRRTTEADLLISRPEALTGFREIYIDFKFRGGTSADVSLSQLDHVAIAIKTGEIQEAHFVSNVSFTEGTRRAVEELNNDLKSLSLDVIKLHEGQTWR